MEVAPIAPSAPEAELVTEELIKPSDVSSGKVNNDNISKLFIRPKVEDVQFANVDLNPDSSFLANPWEKEYLTQIQQDHDDKVLKTAIGISSVAAGETLKPKAHQKAALKGLEYMAQMSAMQGVNDVQKDIDHSLAHLMQIEEFQQRKNVSDNIQQELQNIEKKDANFADKIHQAQEKKLEVRKAMWKNVESESDVMVKKALEQKNFKTQEEADEAYARSLFEVEQQKLIQIQQEFGNIDGPDSVNLVEGDVNYGPEALEDFNPSQKHLGTVNRSQYENFLKAQQKALEQNKANSDKHKSPLLSPDLFSTPASAKPQSNASIWRCTICTFENSLSNTKCAMCESKMPKELKNVLDGNKGNVNSVVALKLGQTTNMSLDDIWAMLSDNKGTLLIKCQSKGKGKPHPKKVKVNNNTCIDWGSSKKYYFRDVISVEPGKVTDVFNESRHKQLDAKCCFSVIFKERTLDLVCRNELMRNAWVLGLQDMIRCYNQGIGTWTEPPPS